MEPIELLAFATSALERLGLRYLVTGSMATIAYGEPRFTNDLDIVVEMSHDSIDGIVQAFPEDEFYLSRTAILEAVRSHRQFNVIHPRSGLKIDFFVASPSDFDQMRLSRGRHLSVLAQGTACFASPEDVILKKLQYFREGGSQKHIRDILGVLRVLGDTVDRAHIANWANRLGMALEWDLVLKQASV